MKKSKYQQLYEDKLVLDTGNKVLEIVNKKDEKKAKNIYENKNKWETIKTKKITNKHNQR